MGEDGYAVRIGLLGVHDIGVEGHGNDLVHVLAPKREFSHGADSGITFQLTLLMCLSSIHLRNIFVLICLL